jgi:hypothetical protein
MSGSPTLLINGADPFAGPDQPPGVLACRLYRDEGGHVAPAPSLIQLAHALHAADAATLPGTPSTNPATLEEVLNGWRGRVAPVDPLERAVHQMILRGFATTAQPPPPTRLATLTADSGRALDEILVALHHLDVIRLDPHGQIALAYPFSTGPTRHRVNIAGQIDVYAMCAIDALGIASMLNQETHITSRDTTTGRTITVTTSDGHTQWNPGAAVVFLPATAGDGPSAECCCDHMNFFPNPTTAATWTTTHPHLPGHILTQEQAHTLATRLFGTLLTND